MKISTRTQNEIEIIDLQGKITIGSGDTQLRDSIQKALADGRTKILLNMKEVTTIDSSGIGELVGSFTSVTNRGGKLKLVNVPPKVTGQLLVTQLITVFEVYDNEIQAISSF